MENKQGFTPLEFRQNLDPKLLNMDPAQSARWLLENKVRTYNALVGRDDGTGIQCPVCNGRGDVAYIPEGEQRMVLRPCQCRPQRQTALRLQQCGMLERARECLLENFRTDTPMQKTMKDYARFYLKEPNQIWFACCGQSGSGKTHICTAIFTRLVMRRGMEGEYMVWGPALRRIRAELYQGSESLLARYRSAPLLYIDDLFKGEADKPLSDADLRLAFELLDFRYNNRLRTILSTERTVAQLTALDQAIAGRIRERCGPYLINISPEGCKNYRFRTTV